MTERENTNMETDLEQEKDQRTISKYTDLNLSSATIRNEMSDLEEMGYILQPHTSAGRIPSDKGYRLYVDELMQEKEKEVTEIKELMIEKTDRLEKVLKQVVRVLASNTNYATMITGPSYHRTKLKFIQLSRVSEYQLLAVIVAEGNLMKNQFIDLEEPIDDEQAAEAEPAAEFAAQWSDPGRDQSGYDPEDETAGRDSQPGGQPGGGCSG